jgi:hypothetical protein
VADVPTKIVAPGDGSEPYEVELTPDEIAQLEADQAVGKTVALAATQAGADDTERLRTINERARTDPAYAALADIVLRGVSR